MLKNTTLIISILTSFMVASCKKNDSNTTTVSVRDVTEVRDENNAAIVAYLKTHFYTFENNEVILDTIAGDNASKTPLYELVETIELDMYDANNQVVTHNLYYLPVQEGTGKQSTVADSVFVSYKGLYLNGIVFDQTKTYTLSNWRDLLGASIKSNNGTVKGFREGVALLKDSASEFTINSDGTINSPTDGGVGVFFMPSRLAYFNDTSTGITAYSPLIFIVNLVRTKNADHDRDGIPSINEIERGERGVTTFTNCDGDSYPDYLDTDACK